MGVAPEAVDFVAITHLHGDHFGWSVTVENGRPRATFPRARYLVPRGDWDYYTRPDVLKSHTAIQTSILPFKDLGAMDLVGDGYAITSEVTTLTAPGHTPGHLCVLITSLGEKGIVVGDLVHTSVQFTVTD